MTDERLEQVIEIFDAAAELSPPARDDYLTATCAGDEELRAEVERLLLRHEQAGDFLEQPVLFDAQQPTGELIGRQIGPYRLLRELGSGGMGVVYLAVRADDVYQKEVAVKLVWPGLQRASLLRRFKQERRILARLDHPHIARLLDGGATEEGWPYVVMEYVDGQPITSYCDERRLTIDDRLRLFRDVCAAVEYAHQNGVIHRDLKPSNIFVTKDGVVKLLDFGIAKLLKPDAHAATLTQTGLNLLTPDYASPEQIRDEEITPCSDVYSLGVLLYELLTGVRPYRIKNPLPHEVARVICEVEPAPPSHRLAQLARAREIFSPDAAGKLRRRMQGDLDNIVLTALAKEPQWRYPSPADFAADIERHLTGQAIVARGSNPLYRLGKRLRRHKFAASLALAVLLVGVGVTLWQWPNIRALRAAQRRTAYYETLRAANVAWQQGQFDRLQEVLQQVAAPERGGFEWRYLWQLTQSQPLTLPHRHPLYSAEFLPDGKVLATVGLGSSPMSLWEAETGKLLAEYADTAPVIWEQLIGDLRVKQVGEELKVWALPSGALLAACPDATANLLRVFSWQPQQWLFAFYDDGTFKQWHWPTCQARVLCRLAPAAHQGLYYSRDHRRLLAWAGDERRELWDLVNGRRLAMLQAELPYKWCRFSDDSRLAMLATQRVVQLYDAARERPLQTITDPSEITFAILSADGRRLITGHNNGAAKVWNTNNGRPLGVVPGGTSPLNHLTLLDGDQRLATVDANGVLRLSNLRNYSLDYQAKAHSLGQPTVHAAPDGQRFVTTGNEGTAKVWRLADLLNNNLLNHHTDRVFSVAFSPDGRTLAAASGDQTISLWDVATRQLRRLLPGHQDLVLCVAFARDGRRLLSSSRDGTARLWDITTGQELLSLEHPTQVHFAAFSPDGKLVTTACDDGRIRFWNGATGQLLRTLHGHAGEVLTLAFSPDGRTLASGGADGAARRWDVATGRALGTLNGHSHWVWSVAFTPDGKHLVTGSRDYMAKLWRLSDSHEVAAFVGHTDEIFEVALSPDGQRLATASNDHTIKIWETATGQELLTIKDHSNEVWSVAFAPDGNTLASGSWDKTVRLWRAVTIEEIKTGTGSGQR